ncbi:MAG: BadF/BadG/BcrA/BcrD ATPase family protein [Litoreibacter sp.]
MSLLIGIDGGGTGCRVAVVETQTGRRVDAEGGPANVSTDMSSALQNLTDALERAATSWGSPLQGACAHLGLAGAYSPEIIQAVSAEFSFLRLKITDDRPTAVVGCLDGQDGFLIMAGTGIIAAHSRAGKQRFVGGYGFALSDHASGAWVGRAVLDASLRCYDGFMAHSPLTKVMLEKFDGDPNNIIEFASKAKPSEYAALAPSVMDAARENDPHAARIVKDGAMHLIAALDALGFKRGDPLCLAGGIGPHYVGFIKPAYLENLILPEGNALDGALYLAAELCKETR